MDNLKPTQNLQPFRHFCMSIGVLPTSYLESLSYAELLYWFCNYLQNTVIPTINNNSECVKELQVKYIEFTDNTNSNYKKFTDATNTNYKKFTDTTNTNYKKFTDLINKTVADLEDYMDNYFNNLDVQQEIDNKLEQMALSG